MQGAGLAAEMEKTEALVLATYPYSESTLIVTLLTREMGVVRGLARGARRGSAGQAAFEPLAHVQTLIRLKSPDALGTLGETTLVEGWNFLRRDLDRLALTALGIETLGVYAGVHPPDAAHLDMGLEFLQAMGQTRAPGSLTVALLARLLHDSGMTPRTEQEWTPETLPARLAWDYAAGMLREERSAAEGPVQPLSRAAGAVVLELTERAPAIDGTWECGAGAGREVLRWLVRVWEDHLGRRLKAAEFLEKMIYAAGGK